MYYLRTKPAANAIQFTVDKSKLKKNVSTETKNIDMITTNGADEMMSEEELKTYNMSAMTCSLQNKDDCLMCGS